MKEHKYFVYIVCSLSGTLYIGMTNSIYRRALEHKRERLKASLQNTIATAWSGTRPTTMFAKRLTGRNS